MEKDFDSEALEYEELTSKKTTEEKESDWGLALGLQKVDDLEPSDYLKEKMQLNIDGEITEKELERMLKKYYSDKDLRVQQVSDEKECDLVSTRIVNIIGQDSFVFHPTTLKAIHKELFRDIYEEAGSYREVDFGKKEIILNEDSVRYFPHYQIEDGIEYDFNEEKKYNYGNKSMEQIIKHIARFTSGIWEIHPFIEGNTRTTGVFMVKYLRSLGFDVSNDLFKENSVYFRNALVRSCYTNPLENITCTDEYLIRFYENLLLGKNNSLHSRDLMVPELFKDNAHILKDIKEINIRTK